MGDRGWPHLPGPVEANHHWARRQSQRGAGEHQGADRACRGLGASPGRVVGRVRLVATPADAEQLQAGEILVTQMTSPDWVPYMRRAAAIVTDSGGMTSHAAIVSREVGLPCIVGTRRATKVLRDGMLVTVDGGAGIVLEAASRRPRRYRPPHRRPARRSRERPDRHGDEADGQPRRAGARRGSGGPAGRWGSDCCGPSSCCRARSTGCTRGD